MIPLRDTTRSKTIPYMNYLLITICGVVFFYELSLGERAEQFILRFGVMPVKASALLHGHIALGLMMTLISSMFLHGGWMHLIGNMLYLYIFGDNVEDRLGHTAYVLFYLLCGIGAALAEVYFHQFSTAPLIGASGAIAGVLGAYFLLYPRAKVLTMIPLVIFFPVVELSAFFFLGFWFIMQFLQGYLFSDPSNAGGVAWWAHAGGFIFGAVLMPIFLLWKKM
jgi:membrane associated rhomboid family serine protease